MVETIFDTLNSKAAILGGNLLFDAADQIVASGNDSNPMSSIAMTTDTDSKMKHNCDAIGRIARGFDVYDIFTVMASVFNILIKSSILVLFSDALTIVFVRMNLKLDKLKEFKYNCCNTTSITIIETFKILSDGTLAATFCLDAICLMIRVMNTLSSIMTVSIELGTSISLIDHDQVVLKLAIYLSNDIDAVGQWSYTGDTLRMCYFLFLCSFTIDICIFNIICIDKLCNHILRYNNTIYALKT